MLAAMWNGKRINSIKISTCCSVYMGEVANASPYLLSILFG